jgi:hypothetical protein
MIVAPGKNASVQTFTPSIRHPGLPFPKKIFSGAPALRSAFLTTIVLLTTVVDEGGPRQIRFQICAPLNQQIAWAPGRAVETIVLLD